MTWHPIRDLATRLVNRPTAPPTVELRVKADITAARRPGLDWQPPRCVHGHILLGCPHDDCPTQTAYLDQQEAALAGWDRPHNVANDTDYPPVRPQPDKDTH